MSQESQELEAFELAVENVVSTTTLGLDASASKDLRMNSRNSPKKYGTMFKTSLTSAIVSCSATFEPRISFLPL